MAVVRNAGARFAPDRFVTDLAANPLESLAIDFHTVVALKDRHQTTATEAWVDHECFVQEAFDANVLLALRYGLIVHG